MVKELIDKKQSEWYQKLILDLKKLAWTKTVEIKHAIGKRIIEDELKFDKPEYGKKRIANLAKDLNCGKTDLYDCIRFVKKYPQFSVVAENSWEHIKRKLLPAPKEEQELLELPLPKGKYNIIYADPAWKYWEGGHKNQEQHYNTMDLDQIKAMPIQNISADNCILFIWATYPYLPNVLEVIEAWGFEYSTVGFVWVKSKKDKTGFAFGCGNWTRANVEMCLIATKGTIERKDKAISQIVYTPLEEHSKKPSIVRDNILKLVGDLPRIELFSRQEVKGWDSWGNEVDGGKNGRNKHTKKEM